MLSYSLQVSNDKRVKLLAGHFYEICYGYFRCVGVVYLVSWYEVTYMYFDVCGKEIATEKYVY